MYKEYFIQGGDWGSTITTLMATLPNSADHVLGLHLNMVPAFPPLNKGLWNLVKLGTSVVLPWFFYSPMEREGLLKMPLDIMMELGYFHEQCSRPQTLAHSLSDSPVGLLAWIIEKFYQWGDCNEDLYSRFTRDELLTNFMIYWTTNSAGTYVAILISSWFDCYYLSHAIISASSVRFYYEFFGGRDGNSRGMTSVERLSVMNVKVGI